MEERRREGDVHVWKKKWAMEQRKLADKLITWNDFNWFLPSDPIVEGVPLKLVGGVDISFVRNSEEDAVASLVVLQLPDLRVVYEVCKQVKIKVPYISGYLAFREVEHFVELIRPLMEKENSDKMPQIILVDGNGILHPRGFGSASHLGVLLGIPTIGVAKQLLCVDGLTHTYVKDMCSRFLWETGDAVRLIGKTGRCYGAAMQGSSHQEAVYYISQGHKINLDTAIEVVRLCNPVRRKRGRYLEHNDYLPMPIVLADSKSRAFIEMMANYDPDDDESHSQTAHKRKRE